MASPAKQVIDNEIRKLLDSYAALEEEKQRHARTAISQQHLEAIMKWLEKEDDEKANALKQKILPSQPLKSSMNSRFVNGLVKAQHQDGEMRFDRHHHAFMLHQPEGLSAEEAVRQAPIRVFAEQIITDVVEVVASPLSHGFNPSPTMNAEQFADQAIAAAEEASLRKMWKTESKKRIPVVYVSHDVASVIQSGCSETSLIISRHFLENKDVITPHIIHNPQRYSFAIGTKFAVLEFDVDMNLEDWQARVLFAPDDPKMIMPIIDNNFI